MFKAYGYSTNDTNKINNSTYVMPLVVTDDFKYKDYCKEDICKNGIIRNNSNINIVLFYIPKSPNYVKIIKFKYGKEEYVPPTHTYFTFLLSLIIASPNIIMYIVRKRKKRMTSSILTLVMNLILNFSYGNLIGESIGLGGYNALKFGQNLLGIYIIACFVFLIMQCICKKRMYFDVIFNLYTKLDDSRSFHELVSYNRKVPPKIVVKAQAQHEESKEVWEEYKYVQYNVYEYTTTYHGPFKITDKKLSSTETKKEYIKTHYSPWKRVKEGGGKFNGIPGGLDSKYVKRVEKKTVATWLGEKEYKYKSLHNENISITNLEYCSIVEASFSYNLVFVKESKNKIELIKE